MTDCLTRYLGIEVLVMLTCRDAESRSASTRRAVHPPTRPRDRAARGRRRWPASIPVIHGSGPCEKTIHNSVMATIAPATGVHKPTSKSNPPTRRNHVRTGPIPAMRLYGVA